MTILNKLYGGDVELTFESFKHQYKIENQVVPSVTQVLSVIAKPALINWAANMAVESACGQIQAGVAYDEVQLSTIWDTARKAHYQKKVDAGNIGTLLHVWISGYIKQENPPMPVNKSLQESVNKFLEWVAKHDVKFLLSEQQIYSKTNNYTGTLDAVCKIDGKLYVLDLKTSSGIYKTEYGMQLAAYKLARSEEFPQEEYSGCILLRIGREGGFETWQFEDCNIYEKGFLAALELYKNIEIIKKQ